MLETELTPEGMELQEEVDAGYYSIDILIKPHNIAVDIQGLARYGGPAEQTKQKTKIKS